eukprot:2084105-Rhodomonas_salina.2
MKIRGPRVPGYRVPRKVAGYPGYTLGNLGRNSYPGTWVPVCFSDSFNLTLFLSAWFGPRTAGARSPGSSTSTTWRLSRRVELILLLFNYS